MKKMLKKIKNKIIFISRLILERIKIHKQLFLFRRWIPNGWVYCDGKSFQIEQFDDTSRKDIFVQKHFVFSFKKEGKLNNHGLFFSGTYKKCLFNGDILYSFCKNKSIYYMNKKNYCSYAPLFNFPYAKTYKFNDKKRLTYSQYIEGKHYRDEAHLLKWAIHLLSKCNVEKYELKNGVLFYIQHGDAWYCNIKWINDDEFVYIDLDRLGFWPALYDIIYGFVVAFKEKAFIMIEEKLFSYLAEFFSRFNIAFSNDVLDLYYSEFVKIWRRRDKKIAFRYIKHFYHLEKDFLKTWRELEIYDAEKR